MTRAGLAIVSMVAALLLSGCAFPASPTASTEETQVQLTVADVRARSIELSEQMLALVPSEQQDPAAMDLPAPSEVASTLLSCADEPGLYWYPGGGAVALVTDSDVEAVAEALLDRLVTETGWPMLQNYQGGDLDYVQTPDGYSITAIGVRANKGKPPRVGVSVSTPCVPAPADDPNALKKY